MVTETRFLFFSNDELIEALAPVFKHRQMKEHVGEPIMVSFGKTKDEMLATHLTYVGTASRRTFSQDEVGAALILLCIRKGIPLPKDVPKRVELRDEQLCLIVGQNDCYPQTKTEAVPIKGKPICNEALESADHETALLMVSGLLPG